MLSAPSAPFGLVKTPGEARRQEGRNAELRAATKADFKAPAQGARATREGGRMSATPAERRERLVELYREVAACTSCPLARRTGPRSCSAPATPTPT